MTVHASNIRASREITPLSTTGNLRKRGIYARVVKRIFDLTLIIASLPFVLPFLLLISILIFASDGHSPIFRQERIGLFGKRFKIWKFRTMVPNAEEFLEKHLEENEGARAEWDEKQKLKHDPRCTSIGRILRRSSLDELPQLINVLMGEMSLVGPRPMMPNQQAMYPGHGYYRLRPGMTGSWQVSARNQTTFADRARFDDLYEQELSLSEDVAIVRKTFGVVLRGTGV